MGGYRSGRQHEMTLRDNQTDEIAPIYRGIGSLESY